MSAGRVRRVGLTTIAVGVVLHVALVLFLVIANARDDEIFYWTDARTGGRTSLWDLQGDYTPVAFFTSLYLGMAAALVLGRWLRTLAAGEGREAYGWLVPAAAALLAFAALDKWFQLHHWARDHWLLPLLGLGGPAALPAALRDPTMIGYAAASLVAAGFLWRGRRRFLVPATVLSVGTVFCLGVYLLDGPAGAALGDGVPVIAAEELLQLTAAFCYLLTALLVAPEGTIQLDRERADAA